MFFSYYLKKVPAFKFFLIILPLPITQFFPIDMLLWIIEPDPINVLSPIKKFPFIIAVSGLTKEEVFSRIKARLKNSTEKEFNTAIDEIHKIAEIRLKNLY